MTKQLSEKARDLLGPLYNTVDVMKSARNSESTMMAVWADDMKAVEDVMLFLESLRDMASAPQS